MRALWLPDELRDAGLKVSVYSGFAKLGKDTLDPVGVLVHHTATAGSALKTCIQGRPDLPGPLANINIHRDGTVYVIASGTANHAGRGSRWGVMGNHRTYGIELDNRGTGEPYPPVQYQAALECCAVVSRHHGWNRDKTAGHREWTTRKIDPVFNMNAFRNEVGAKLEHDPYTGGTDLYEGSDRMRVIAIQEQTARLETEVAELHSLLARVRESNVADSVWRRDYGSLIEQLNENVNKLIAAAQG